MSKDTISYDINFLELTLQVWAEIRKDVQFVELSQESELLSMAGRLALQAAKESCGNAEAGCNDHRNPHIHQLGRVLG